MKTDTRQIIRQMYKSWLPIIKKDYPRFDAYGGNWSDWIFFTPIERNVWSNIRYLGLPFVPQFPVKGYFIDFADPIKKIGIEVDGKEWHQNYKKDELRQKEIEDEGWTIYRIQGKDTFKTLEDYFGEKCADEIEKNCACATEELFEDNLCGWCSNRVDEFYWECSEGRLMIIKKRHYQL